MVWTNNLTERLKIIYPVIQAPMLGVSTPRMVAAVSNEGGLGSLPVGGLSPETTSQLIEATKSLTNKPFAVNLFAHEVHPYANKDLEAMQQFILQLSRKRGLKIEASDLSNLKFYTYPDQIEILVREDVPIVGFTFGCLDQNSIHFLKNKGTTLIGTATCVEEAMFLQEQNIDMISVQGIEAGGHRGTFFEHIPLPQIGLFSLLPQIAKAVQVPLIAAGGINSPQTMKAAFDLGAMAVQMGTVFIGTNESEAIPSYKQRLETAKDKDTTLTKAFTGRWARGFRNEMMNEIEQSGIPIPAYPLQNSLTAKLRRLAQLADDAEYTSLWAGQSAGISDTKQATQVLINLVKGYEAMYP